MLWKKPYAPSSSMPLTFAASYIFRGNIESKLSELGISKSNARESIHDIFGNPVLFEEGLVDADANSLDAEFKVSKSVWNEREHVLSNCSQPQFHSWFWA